MRLEELLLRRKCRLMTWFFMFFCLLRGYFVFVNISYVNLGGGFLVWDVLIIFICWYICKFLNVINLSIGF